MQIFNLQIVDNSFLEMQCLMFGFSDQPKRYMELFIVANLKAIIYFLDLKSGHCKSLCHFPKRRASHRAQLFFLFKANISFPAALSTLSFWDLSSAPLLLTPTINSDTLLQPTLSLTIIPNSFIQNLNSESHHHGEKLEASQVSINGIGQ